MRLLIGIPAYNEEFTLKQVLASLPKKIAGIRKIDILVVDDGSSDKTKLVASFFHVKVASHLLNRGLGGALKTIFAYAKKNQYDFLITFDADGQHDSKDIPRLIQAWFKKEKDVIIGSRWKNKVKAPFLRLFINQAANILTYLLFGIKTSDSQSGLRVFSKNAIQKICLESDGMEVSTEIFREIYRHKLTYGEISINPIYTPYSQTKGQKILNAPQIFFQLVLRLLK